jgi:hypothetical protein
MYASDTVSALYESDKECLDNRKVTYTSHLLFLITNHLYVSAADYTCHGASGIKSEST